MLLESRSFCVAFLSRVCCTPLQQVYNLVQQGLLKKLQCAVQRIASLALHPGGDNLIVGSEDRRVCWFDMDLSTKPYKTIKYVSRAQRVTAFVDRLASQHAPVHLSSLNFFTGTTRERSMASHSTVRTRCSARHRPMAPCMCFMRRCTRICYKTHSLCPSRCYRRTQAACLIALFTRRSRGSSRPAMIICSNCFSDSSSSRCRDCSESIWKSKRECIRCWIAERNSCGSST